jgi:hypothetical protein
LTQTDCFIILFVLQRPLGNENSRFFSDILCMSEVMAELLPHLDPAELEQVQDGDEGEAQQQAKVTSHL